MITTIVATPQDSVPPVLRIIPGMPLTLILDFTAVLQVGQTVASATITMSGNITLSAKTMDMTRVEMTFSNSMRSGQTATATCDITTTDSFFDGRSLRFVAYDTV